MHIISILGVIWLIFAAQARAHPYDHRTRDDTTKGLSVESADLLGIVRSATTYVTRDLGFQGQLGEYIVLTYGDTMYSDSNYSDTWRGMTSDSAAFATHDPLLVVDADLDENGFPRQFCPINKKLGEDAAVFSLGITNVVEIEPEHGELPCF
jgi:hypothetical protein